MSTNYQRLGRDAGFRPRWPHQIEEGHQSYPQLWKCARGQRDVPGARAGAARRQRAQQGLGAGHRRRLLQVLRRHQGAVSSYEDPDAEREQHSDVPSGQPAQGRPARRQGRPKAALRQGLQGLRLQVPEDREGEEVSGQGGRPHQDRGHAGRDSRRNGEGTETVPAADV